MPRHYSRCLLALLFVLLLSACGVLTPAPTAASVEPTSTQADATQSGVTPAAADPSATAGVPTEPASTPTQPPTISAWPLPADLYFLDEGGRLWRQPLRGDQQPPEPITREDRALLDFDVAPGGTWIMTRTADAVAITSIDGQRGQIIAQDTHLPAGVTPAFGAPRTVAWSPHAAMLAYVTEAGFQIFAPGADNEQESLVFGINEAPLSGLSWSPTADWLLIRRVDGTAALYSIDPLRLWVDLGPIHDHAWLADGRLAFAPSAGGLALVTPGDAGSRAFIVPQERLVTRPFHQPDGSLTFYVHSGSVDQPGFLHTADPDALSFSIVNNLPVDTAHTIWGPQGDRLLTLAPSQSGTMGLIDPLTGARGTLASERAVQPVVSWGDPPPPGVAGMALPADLYYLAPQAGVTQVWRLPANGEPPTAITTATEDITAFDVAFDGGSIVYTAGRTIYRRVLNTLELSEVATLSDEAESPTGTPAIAPGGRQIAYADNGIRIIDLDTGRSRRLLRDTLPGPGQEATRQVFDQPRWSLDGEWLLVRASFHEGTDQVLLRLPGDDGILNDPVFLGLFGASGEWIADRAYVYSTGGVYGDPFLTMIQPADPPNFARLLSIPVADVALREDGRLAVLRVPFPGAGGPTVVRTYSARTTGSDLEPESSAFVLDRATLAPDSQMIAGLYRAGIDERGHFSGQLALIDTASGVMRLIDSAVNVHSLQWAR